MFFTCGDGQDYLIAYLQAISLLCFELQDFFRESFKWSHSPTRWWPDLSQLFHTRVPAATCPASWTRSSRSSSPQCFTYCLPPAPGTTSCSCNVTAPASSPILNSLWRRFGPRWARYCRWSGECLYAACLSFLDLAFWWYPRSFAGLRRWSEMKPITAADLL